MTHQDLSRLTEAATRWHRQVSGMAGAFPASLSSLDKLIGEIPSDALTPRLAWEGRHLQSLIRLALYMPLQAS